MAHCGFEGTAVDDAFSHPLKALRVALFGPRVDGPMQPEHAILYDRIKVYQPAAQRSGEVAIPVGDIKRTSKESEASSSIADVN